MHDEDVYPNANLFRPQRFFNADGTLNDDTIGFAFGFGRRYAVFIHDVRNTNIICLCRICPGRHAAEPVVSHFIPST